MSIVANFSPTAALPESSWGLITRLRDLAEERPTYDALAARLGLSWNDVKNRLECVRELVRAAVRAELAQVTSSAEELDDEWAAFARG